MCQVQFCCSTLRIIYSLSFSYKISIPAESVIVKSIELEVGAQTDKTVHAYSYKRSEVLTTNFQWSNNKSGCEVPKWLQLDMKENEDWLDE